MISIMPGENPLVRRVNVQGTLNVLKTAMQSGVERLVYTSSIHALARIPHGSTVGERPHMTLRTLMAPMINPKRWRPWKCKKRPATG